MMNWTKESIIKAATENKIGVVVIEWAETDFCWCCFVHWTSCGAAVAWLTSIYEVCTTYVIFVSFDHISNPMNCCYCFLVRFLSSNHYRSRDQRAGDIYIRIFFPYLFSVNTSQNNGNKKHESPHHIQSILRILTFTYIKNYSDSCFLCVCFFKFMSVFGAGIRKYTELLSHFNWNDRHNKCVHAHALNTKCVALRANPLHSSGRSPNQIYTWIAAFLSANIHWILCLTQFVIKNGSGTLYMKRMCMWMYIWKSRHALQMNIAFQNRDLQWKCYYELIF